jgi:hypothetical protein
MKNRLLTHFQSKKGNAGYRVLTPSFKVLALFQKINEKLQEKIPGYNLALQPGSFEKTGSLNTTSFGYRYVIILGIRF